LQRARVEVTLVRKKGQAPVDPDNQYARAKAPLDGLVVGGMLSDDSAEHVEVLVRQEQGAQRATRLEVTELVPERSADG
jgi:xanthine/CO dehydrogenase XdhC/CoxF family maturation factor